MFSEGFLRKHLSVTLRGPCAQTVCLTRHVNDSIVHLDDDRRDWCLLCHFYLVDGTAAAGPIMPELVLSLPVCSPASFDQVFVVQPFRCLRCEVQAFVRSRDIFEAWQAARSRSDEAVIIVLLPQLAVASKHTVFVRESACLALCRRVY